MLFWYNDVLLKFIFIVQYKLTINVLLDIFCVSTQIIYIYPLILYIFPGIDPTVQCAAFYRCKNYS